MGEGKYALPNLWRRWDSQDVYLFNYCSLGWSGKEEANHPCGKGLGESHVPIEYISGPSRIVIRHTPLVVLILLLFEFGPWVFSTRRIWIGGLLTVAVLMAVFSWRFNSNTFYRKLTQYIGGLTLVALLLGGTAVHIHDSLTAGTPLFNEPLGASGYLLLLYLGGLLVYDGMLKTENLLCKLGDCTNIVAPTKAYNEKREELAKQLRISGWNSWTVSHKSAAVILFIVVLGGFTIQNLVGQELVIPALIDSTILLVTRAFIVIVAFKFVVLITFIKNLADSSDDGDVRFVYHPYHPDEMGGFRDIGKFATRVNRIIFLGGAYLLYFSISEALLPMLLAWTAYIAVVGLWFWASIYQLHRRMVKDRVPWYFEGGMPDLEVEPIGGFSIDPSWENLRDAPEWPLPRGQLTRLVSTNLAPVILWMLKILFPGFIL